MGKFVDLTGKKFNRLIVLNRSVNKGKKVAWDCQCDCGNLHSVSGTALKSGEVKSCGCLHRENLIERNTIHSNTGSYTYQSWLAIRNRCYQQTKMAKNYKDRGIQVCEHWLNSFENFLEDMGKRPHNTTLDRIDVNGNYEPSNCRWATDSLQNYNRRKQCNNSSGRSGVTPAKNGKWVSRISVDNKRIYLGTFSNLDDAILARTEAEIIYYGFTKE